MGKAAAAGREELEGQTSIDDVLVPLGELPVELLRCSVDSTAEGASPRSLRDAPAR